MVMQGHRLPTRVSSACDRCRKLKQRCDVLRPCSNCINAGRECVGIAAPAPPPRIRTAKRARLATSPTSPKHSTPQEPIQAIEPGSPVQQRNEASHGSFSHAERPSLRSVVSNSWLSESSWGERSIVAEFGSSNSAMDITRRVFQSRGSDPSTDRATFAIPGGDFSARRNSTAPYHSVFDLIGVKLPSKSTCDTLLDVYFFTVHWFSLVVYEPTFRQRYQTIILTGSARSADRPFLLLLLMVLVMSCQYGYSVVDDEFHQTNDLNSMRIGYLKVVRQNFMDLLDEDSLEFVQICTLLGSYWLYWGKPRSSFTILGAAVKSAQAISLHRQANWRLSQNDTHTVEESKRVWWTIYTWDRFATIVYGRPLGINDRDCDVLMPADFFEHLVDPLTSEEADVKLSSYQVQLNRVYRIASPLLENIYGIRCPGDTSLSEMAQTVRRVDESMQAWCGELPAYLDLDQWPDLAPHSSLQEKMHCLQSLSLRLTYLNLMIIIHRPLLADWRHRRTRESRAQSIQSDRQDDSDSMTSSEKQIYSASFQQCLTAALAVSQLERSKPRLVQLAGRTHLLSFLAMNVFTSSIVLFICALSDTLSNESQEAKRGMSRNLRILRSLSNADSLSSQCSTVIQDLIQMIMDKEREQLLLGPVDNRDSPAMLSSPRRFRYDHQDVAPQDAMHYTTPASMRSHPSLPGVQANRTSSNFPDSSGMPLERTMEQLHRVLKDASHTRASQRAEASYHQPSVSNDDQSRAESTLESAWPNAMSWDAGYLLGGETYAQDMNQFWLWDMDLENRTSWEPNYDA